MIQSEERNIYHLRHPKSQKHKVHLYTQSEHTHGTLIPSFTSSNFHRTSWAFLTEKLKKRKSFEGLNQGVADSMLCLKLFSCEVVSIAHSALLQRNVQMGNARLCQAEKKKGNKQESWPSDTFRPSFLKIWLNLLVWTYKIIYWRTEVNQWYIDEEAECFVNQVYAFIIRFVLGITATQDCHDLHRWSV